MRKADRLSTGEPQVTRESVAAAWADVSGIPPIRDYNAAFRNALEVLSVDSEDWSKRCQQLKTLRAIVLQGPGLAPSAHLHMLNEFIGPLEKCVRDLRSQVVREAALTISLLITRYKSDLRALAELCLPAAFAQIAVKTKIIASAAAVLSTFLVEEVHTKQMFGIIASNITSKDKSHRRRAVTLLGTVIGSWEEKAKVHHMRQLCELLKAGINDADSETRIAARKAFKVLNQLHPSEADQVFRSVDPSKQKLLRAPDGGSSMSSLNGDRNTPFKSRLASRPSTTPKPVGFLGQRSHTVMEKKTSLDKVDTSPGGSKFARPALNMGMRTNSHLGRSTQIPAPKTSLNSMKRRDNAPATAPSGIQRVKSNLGPDSFCGSLTGKKLADFEETLRQTARSLRQPSKNDEDDFLLPKRPNKTPVKEQLSRVDAILKAATSVAPNEKREGIQHLKSLAVDPKLTEAEVQKVGEVLNRLASETTSPVILDTLGALVQTHSAKMTSWLVPGLHQQFAMAHELVPGRKAQVAQTIDTILESFDPPTLLKAQCDILSSRILAMKSAARIPFLDFLATLFQRISPVGLQKCLIHVGMENLKTTMFKILDWSLDSKNGSVLQPHVEKVLLALSTLNNGLFNSIFEGAEEHHRQFINTVILQSLPIRRISEETQNLPRSRRSDPLYVSPKAESPRYKLAAMGPLRPINGDDLEISMGNLEISAQNPQEPKEEKSELVETEVEKIHKNLLLVQNSEEKDKLDGLIQLQKMVTDGSFTLWDEFLPQIRTALFTVLQSGEDSCKRRALRFISRLCERCSSRMLDSTEQIVENVLNCAATSTDRTTKTVAGECLQRLSTTLVMSKVVEIIRNELRGDGPVERKEIVLEMISQMFEKLDDFELNDSVALLAPILIEMFNDDASSILRKGAARGLLSLRTKMGDQIVQPYFVNLSAAKQRLLEKLHSTRPSEC